MHELDQLVERLAPALLESHRRMPPAVLWRAMHDAGAIERAAALRAMGEQYCLARAAHRDTMRMPQQCRGPVLKGVAQRSKRAAE